MTGTTDSAAPDHVDLDPDLAHVVAALRDLKLRRDRLDEEEGELKARLRKVLVAGQRGYVDGQPAVTLQPNRRFNLDRAVGFLPAEVAERCRVHAYDPKQVKRFLAPAVLDLCMDAVGDPKVVLL